MRRSYYWAHMENDVKMTFRGFESCKRTQGTQYDHVNHLKLFPVNRPLEFITMDLLGPLPKTKRETRTSW